MSKLVDRAFLTQGRLNSAVKKLKLKRSKGLSIEATELLKADMRRCFTSLICNGYPCDKVYGFNNLYMAERAGTVYYYVELRKEDANA
jgi:hypothetical protein